MSKRLELLAPSFVIYFAVLAVGLVFSVVPAILHGADPVELWEGTIALLILSLYVVVGRPPRKMAHVVAVLLAMLTLDIGRGLAVNYGSLITRYTTGGGLVCSVMEDGHTMFCQMALIPPLGRFTVNAYLQHGVCVGTMVALWQVHLRDQALWMAEHTCGKRWTFMDV